MATLAELLTTTAEDPDLEAIRNFLKTQMGDVRASLFSAEADRAYWLNSKVVDDRKPMDEERKLKGKIAEQVTQNLLAKYNAFEARLKALPEVASEVPLPSE